MRLTGKCFDQFEQIPSTNSIRKCKEITLDNLYVDIKAYRVKAPE